MKNHIICLLFLIKITSFAQTLTPSTASFNKLIISPEINLVLVKGEKEALKIDYSGISADKIKVSSKGKTLHIYLKEAQFSPKKQRNLKNNYKESIYSGANITAFVTFDMLKYLEIRGTQQVTCQSVLKSKKLTLKISGEAEVQLDTIETEKLKVKLYGENKLTLLKGVAKSQKYKVYGENKVLAQDFSSESIKAYLFGESKLQLSASQTIKVLSFGESRISYSGAAKLHKMLVLGSNSFIHQ